jgi:hypothetical protein
VARDVAFAEYEAPHHICYVSASGRVEIRRLGPAAWITGE